MMMTRRSRPLVPLLVLFNVLLLSLLFYEVVNMQQQGDGVTAIVSPQKKISVNKPVPVIARSIEDYDEVVSRPLFNKERLPLEKGEQASSDEDALAFNLVGVVLTPEQQVAIIYSRSQQQPVKVLLWGWIDGWRLISVQANVVHLRKGNRSLELLLQRTSRAVAG